MKKHLKGHLKKKKKKVKINVTVTKEKSIFEKEKAVNNIEDGDQVKLKLKIFTVFS